MNLNQTRFFTLIIVVLLVLFVLTLVSGPVHIPFNSIFKIIAGDETVNKTWQNIFWDIRLPKAMVAILAGASLSVCGLMMQTFFQNPLAGPFVLGINSGASLGVALWILAFNWIAIQAPWLKNLGLILSSILGSTFVLFIILLLSLRFSGKVIILVFGLLFSYLASGIINILVSLSDSWEIKTFLLWGFGSFQRVDGLRLVIFSLVTIIGLLLSFLASKSLNGLLLGDRYSQSIGVSLNKTKTFLLLLTAILAGTVTAFCGPIAFIGVIIPHLTKLLFKTGDHRILIPGSILLGAVGGLFAEFISSFGGTFTFPINSILGLIGAPLIVIFLLKRRESEAL